MGSTLQPEAPTEATSKIRYLRADKACDGGLRRPLAWHREFSAGMSAGLHRILQA